QLARRVQECGLPARRPAAAAYRPGDRRTFVFDAFPPVPRQLVPARVVATNDRAVALVDEGWYDADPQAPAAARLQEVIDQFARDYDRAAAAFGTPSDVDGDGRIAFLFTPLVAQVGIAGFQDPGSALPESVGGNGNLTDLLFLSPAEADRSFRSLLVHEFQHLINFHQHVLLRGGPAEASWLNEGLSHVSEDLVEGFTDGGNALLVQAYLAEPGAVGLEGNALMDLRKRGAAYLFVRSLVDRLGEGVLPRLVQSGLADRDNLEAALGEPFGELLAFWSAQVYASGTELAGPSRFEYAFGYLRSPGGRGFPMPTTLLYREGGPGIAGDLRPRGANYVRLSGSGRRAVEVRVDRDAAAGATIFPLPRGFVPPVAIPAGYFADLALAPPLPGELATGEALAIAGQLDRPGADRLALVFTPAAGGQATTFYLPVAGGRFERAVVFDHSEAGEYDLALFAGPTGGTLGYLGRFWPVRIRAGTGAVHLPAAYFNGLRLDGPLPAIVLPGAAVPLAGRALDPAVTTVLFRLVDTAGQQLAGQYLDVVAGRFEGSLSTSGLDLGTYQIEAYLGDAELAYAGGFPFFRVAADLPTAVTAAAALPAALGLEQNYPNPFNGDTVIPFRLPGPAATPVELVLFDALGQRVAVLAKGLLEPGLHEARWDGRDAAGRAAASGVYLYRLTAGRQVAVRHLALTR
ncbi:MAG: T9SS type A sorting domain-containing protein, partial [Gemmatimonadota bacterium]